MQVSLSTGEVVTLREVYTHKPVHQQH